MMSNRGWGVTKNLIARASVAVAVIVASVSVVAHAGGEPAVDRSADEPSMWRRHYLRHGTKVVMAQDGARIAVSCGAGDAYRLVVPAIRAQGLRVAGVEEIVAGETSVVTLAQSSRLPTDGRQWRRLASRVVEAAGLRWCGPVFFKDEATTVVTGRIWVFVDEAASESAARALVGRLGLRMVGWIPAARNIAVAEIAEPSVDPVSFALELAKNRNVDAVPELMRRYYRHVAPTDTYYALQWGLQNTGSNVEAAFGGQLLPAVAMADIRAELAWDETTGDPSVVVGVIDSGVDCLHPDLDSKCLGGLNAITNDPDGSPPDPSTDMSAGHGTSVASVAAAAMDGDGVVGVCPGCSVVPVRLIESATFLTDEMILAAFTHAVDQGSGVINNSWGPKASGFFIPASNGELEGFDYALTQGRGGLGTLVVYAAGNENQSTSFLGHLQTGHENVIAVAASDQLDYRSEYSNYGAHITLSAPSSDGFLNPAIYAAEIRGNGDVDADFTSAFGGTSAAAPVVSGVAALVLTVAPDLTAAELVDLLVAAADRIDPDGGRYDASNHSIKYGYGRVNGHRAVLAALGSLDRPWCAAPAADEDCDVHRDDDCDGMVDEGCDLAPTMGVECASPAECGAAPFWECPQTGKQRGLCTWDCSLQPCPAGSACVDGLCSLECASDTECATGFVCSNDELGVCLPSCGSDTDCGQGEVCDPDTSICKLDTDGQVGSPCSEPEDCVGGGFCLSEMMGFPGGYCTRTCTDDTDCEGADRCVFIADHGSFCYDGCSLDGDCREDYVCEQSGPRAGTCYKMCERDDQCTGGDPAWDSIVCELASGRCIDTSEPDAGVDATVQDGGVEDGAADTDGATPDASTPAATGNGSCGCRLGRRHSSSAGWPAILLFGLFLLMAARRES
jgi:subtilisin family serine protease